jgi:hypothetical protein
VAVLGTPSPADPIPAFDRAWVFMIVASGLGAAAMTRVGSPHRVIAAAAPEAAPA